MAEFQELKVSVTFTDNASDKLKDVNAQLAKLGTGGDVNRKAVEGFKVSTDLVSKLATEVRGVANAFNLFGGLPIFKLGAGAGFAGIVLAIKQTNDALGAFAKELLALRDMSRSAGLLPDQFKNVASQLRLVGYTSDEASREVLNFVRTIDEASRPGTSQFMRIYEMSATPELAMSRINQMRDLIRSGQPGQAIALAAREARAIYERELNSRGMQEARRQAESWLSSVGLSMRALGINDISDFLGDPQKWQRRIEAAERFNVEYEKFNKVLGGLITDIKMELLPLFEDLNKALTAGAFDSVLASIKTDVADFRKIMALLEGDYAKLAELLPKGPARRAALNLAEQMRRDLETEGEKKAPTASGRIEQFRQRQRSYRDWKDKQLENNEEGYGLLEELKRLNTILFQIQAEKDAAKVKGTAGAPAFHNAPQGGAQGESNPMTLPPGHPQPGGGAPAESRVFQPGQGSLFRPWRPGDPVTGTFKGKPYPFLDPTRATPLPPRQGERNPVFSGVSEGRGVASWFGQGQGWGDKPSMDQPGSNALRVPENLQGISLSDPKTVGQFFYVTDPNTGLTHVRQQTDAGPGVRTQKLVDVSVAAAQREGYTKQSFEAMQGRVERGELPPWEVQNTGFGTRGTSTAPARPGTIPTVETQNITRLDRQPYDPRTGGGTNLPSGMDVEFDPFKVSGGPAWSSLDPGGGRFGGGGGGSFGGGGATNRGSFDGALAAEDRGGFDGALAAEANIDASANLDVNVRGPAGVDVKANGDGMFKGNTSVSRQVELQ